MDIKRPGKSNSNKDKKDHLLHFLHVMIMRSAQRTDDSLSPDIRNVLCNFSLT